MVRLSILCRPLSSESSVPRKDCDSFACSTEGVNEQSILCSSLIHENSEERLLIPCRVKTSVAAWSLGSCIGKAGPEPSESSVVSRALSANSGKLAAVSCVQVFPVLGCDGARCVVYLRGVLVVLLGYLRYNRVGQQLRLCGIGPRIAGRTQRCMRCDHNVFHMR